MVFTLIVSDWHNRRSHPSSSTRVLQSKGQTVGVRKAGIKKPDFKKPGLEFCFMLA